eukprot:CAMPEP_0194039022 /NCGR_PEP_ID=MMETSP0009_2-20130614/11211_1 /TAXON_ID=210454 /ORGANISM="Grammatophora oceanica, Strain CCMP 410" /LENGTH=561 /DNA_ID=CAMNT_0038681721 /DNA_START=332 /DNA_END=2017 /DNA_ORIENTATION=+
MPSIAPSMQPSLIPKDFKLVFSDEFNTPGRTFADGTDPRWTALDKNDYTNDALHYYTPDNVKTNDNGELVITSMVGDTDVIGFDDVKRKNTHVVKHFRSGMVQSWNKFCFTGGIIEARVTLPGKADTGGLWPAFWMLGNLARHTYVGSSQHIWPWSAPNCTLKAHWAQQINGCARVLHYGLERGRGRGAPEIDVFEVQPGNIRHNTGPFWQMSVGQPFMSASYQVAPGRLPRPGDGWWPGPSQWYDGLTGGHNTSLNILFYGNYNHFRGDTNAKKDYWSDAISFNRQLDQSHFSKPHTYRVEWEPARPGHAGYIRWYLDNEIVLDIDGGALDRAGQGSEISSEPMYILLNTAISKQWGFPHQCPASCPCKKYNCQSPEWEQTCGFSEGFCDMLQDADGPPEYKIDWVRIYQDPDNEVHKVGCSTPERPTRRYIEAHEALYKTEDDLHPLRGIQRGRGVCSGDPESSDSRQTCGGLTRGRCTGGHVCECHLGWTGPHCLAHQGSDPILYDIPDKISDIGFTPPRVAPYALTGSLLALLLVFIVALMWRREIDGWRPIPDAKI